MRRQTKIILLCALVLALVAAGGFAAWKVLGGREEAVPDRVLQLDPTAEQTETTAPSEEASQPPEEQTQPEEETTEATEEAVEVGPQEQWYVLSFAGDCTMGSTAATYWYESSYIQTIGEDYTYPFKNVLNYFEDDDFTIVNLECALTRDGGAADKLFTFKGPPEYTQILTGSSIEAVTVANNHSMDYGAIGYNSTKKALQEANVPFVEKDGTAMVTTMGGLKIGLYAGCFDFSVPDMKAKIGALRSKGAEIVICAFHWGVEGSYRPTANQEYFGRAAIDAGADIVYGCHPHVLQKIESYGKGVIMYSLGNFSFGGSTFPKDYDSAIIQVKVVRGLDGKVRLGEVTSVPVLISSMKGQNNYQPTPVEEGSDAYNRILSKLDGSFTGPDLVVDYNILKPTEPAETEPAATEGTEPPATQGTEPPATQATEPPATEATQPPATEPPATEPPATQPPATEPPTTQPPATEAPPPPPPPSEE